MAGGRRLGAEGAGAAEALCGELQQLLARLAKVTDALAEAAAGGAGDAHTVSRHRERLGDFAQEFAKTRATLRSQQEKAELLSSVQRDISCARAGGAPSPAPPAER